MVGSEYGLREGMRPDESSWSCLATLSTRERQRPPRGDRLRPHGIRTLSTWYVGESGRSEGGDGDRGREGGRKESREGMEGEGGREGGRGREWGRQEERKCLGAST